MNELFRIKESALERIRFISMAPIELKANNFTMITIMITPGLPIITRFFESSIINELENCIRNFAIY